MVEVLVYIDKIFGERLMCEECKVGLFIACFCGSKGVEFDFGVYGRENNFILYVMWVESLKFGISLCFDCIVLCF